MYYSPHLTQCWHLYLPKIQKKHEKEQNKNTVAETELETNYSKAAADVSLVL
jgi:hypothetical protein